MAKEEPPVDGDGVIKKYVEACQTGNLVEVRELVEAGIVDVVDGRDRDEQGVTGLHWAAINNRLSVVEYLVVRAGAAVDSPGGDLAATPLHWACRYGLVHVADFLLAHGADPSRADTQGYSALLLAVHSSNVMLVLYLLAFCPELASIADPQGRSPLHWAAYQGDTLSVEALLKLPGTVHAGKAALNAPDSQGFTPLHWALLRSDEFLLKRLIEEGANINATTNDGKNAFVIAQDMNTTPAFQNALHRAGLDHAGKPLKKYTSARTAKLITFFIPYLIIGSAFITFTYSNIFLTLLFTLLLIIITRIILTKFIFQSYIHASHPWLKSPYISGIFSGSAFWVILSWLLVVMPSTIFDAFLTNTVFAILVSIVVYTFFSTMFSDPGIIPGPSSVEEIKSNIKDLLQSGHYDAKHFCIYTFIKKPLRAKYSNFYNSCVARFDHFCPWTYNDIGLQNHKIFMFFIISLEIAIIPYFFLTHGYFQSFSNDDHKQCTFLSDTLCAGFNNSRFIFILYLWIWFNFLWVSFLLISQLIQISKGITTFEFSTLHQKIDPSTNPYYSSTPEDMLNSSNMTIPQLPKQKTCFTNLCLITGLDQFVLAFKQALGFKDSSSLYKIKTDYGLRQNCTDFWFVPSDSNRVTSLLKFQGDLAYLNGIKVEYSKLYALPEKINYEQSNAV